MTVYAMRKGTSPNPTVVTTVNDATNNINFNCPTNPLLVDSATVAATNRLFAYICTEPNADAKTFVQRLQSGDSAGHQYSNLSNTEGYKIHCYDNNSETGLRLNGIAPISSQANEWFVLIYSDDALTHHFARITEINTDDVLGDSFDFEPRLGTKIPRDTKFMVFQGPTKTDTSVIAVSAGILNSEITGGYRYNKAYITARPIFYFFDDRLDKKNELDHNKKYYLKYDDSNMGSATVTPSQTNCFVTVEDFSTRILDYSKYTMKASVIDNLRNLDDPTISAVTSNEGNTLPTNDFTDYDECFFNARRDTDNFFSSSVSTLELKGPYRYVHYNHSPEKANTNFSLVDFTVLESIGDKGGYADAKLYDTQRILPTKIKEFDLMRLRHRVHTANIHELFALKAKVNSLTSGQTYVFDTEYDLSLLLSVGNEVKVGNRMVIVKTIASFSAQQQTIVFETSSRLETESSFSTSSYTLSAGDRLYRRAWSQSKGNLLTTFKIIDNRSTNLKVVFNNLLEATVTGSSAETKTLTVSYDNSLYEASSSVGFFKGAYTIEIERFEGDIEQIDSVREHGQNFTKISGRSNYSKLISPLVNKNYSFSKDIIYSSNSPYNSMEKVGTAPVLFNSTTFTLASVTVEPVVNDHLFVKYTNKNMAYIGQVQEFKDASHGTDPLQVTLTSASFTSTVDSGGTQTEDIWKISNKNYILSKALSSDNRNSIFPTSLTGATEKGLFFESGVDTSSSNSDLVGTSASTDTRAIGYHFNNPTNIRKDEAFQAVLSDGGTTYSSVEPVNSLMDFTVVSSNTKDGKTTLELAPYVPLTLGRLEYNDADASDTTFDTVGNSVGVVVFGDNKKYIEVDGLANSPAEKDPVYIAGIFAGYITQLVKPSTSTNWRIYTDRVVEHTASQVVSILNTITRSTTIIEEKYTSDLYFVNGGHLHGGKFVSLLHPFFGNNKPMIFNIAATYITGVQSTTSEMFGQPLYRISHMEKGTFDFVSPAVVSTSNKDASNFYLGGSKLGYYASGYKIGGGSYIDSSTYYDSVIGRKVGFPHLPIEMRGNFPASGSLFFDYEVFESGHTKPTIFVSSDPTDDSTTISGGSRYRVKDILEQFDSKASRLFLFSNSDLFPYTSNRSDSLMNSSVVTAKDDLKKFKLMLMSSPTSTAGSVKQSKMATEGSSLALTDESYEDAAIIDVDKNITELKRAGIMRLTEVVFDVAFNQFNPEKPPAENRTIPEVTYFYHSFASLSCTVVSYGSSQIGVSTAISVSDNDILVDSNRNFIGTVNGNQSSVTVINLDLAPVPTNGGSAYTGTLFKVDTMYRTAIKGHGGESSFLNFEKEINFLKGVVHNDAYAPTSSDFISIFGASNTLIRPQNTAIHSNQFSNLILPLSFNDGVAGGVDGGVGNSTSAHHPSTWLSKVDALPNSDSSTVDTIFQNQLHGVFLGRFSVEGGITEADEMMTKGTTFPANNNTHLRKYSLAITTMNMGLSSASNFMSFKNSIATERTAQSNDADGVFIGFKFRLNLDSSLGTVTKTTINMPNGDSAYQYKITGTEILDLVKDLTGCYLASEHVNEYSTGSAKNATYPANPQGINNSMPVELAYVLSHAIDRNTSTLTHIITVDKNLAGKYYRVMQPNETTFYNFTPNRIKLNTLSSEYTKIPFEDKTYQNTKDYLLLKGSGSGGNLVGSSYTYNNEGHNEAVLSMYVLVDPDMQALGVGRDEIVPRTHTSSYYVFADAANFYEKNYSFCLSDGDATYKTSAEFQYLGASNGSYVEFGEMKTMKGIVSMSETFSVTTSKNVKIRPKRAMIGSVVNVCSEAETILNDLLETNDIEYSFSDTNDYPLFLAPNYKSTDLFSSINYVLERKDKALIYENDAFSIRNKTNSTLNPKVFITDRNDKFQIGDFGKSDVLFDFFNEIIVYGDSHVSTKRNLRSIKARGKKTLEIDEPTIFTQQDADKRATELLRLHSRLNQKVTIEIGQKGISHLRAGDIISLELLRENIEKNQYIILEMEHGFNGFVKMQLGRFSKGLEDRFAELLISTRKNRALLRPKELAEANENASFLDSIKINERRLLIQTRVSSGGSSFSIGFVEEIGFGVEMGFGTSGSTITITTVREAEY